MYVHQAINHALGITTFGSSLLRTEANLAQICLTVSRLEQHPKNALEATQEAAKAVREVLRQLEVPEGSIQLSRITVETAYENYHRSHPIGYEASVEIRILIGDIGKIETLLIAVVDAGAHKIDSVRYQSKNLKELRAQARRQAVESARKKAELYAKAAGVRAGAPIHIEDVNPDNLRNRGHQPDIDVTEHDEGGQPGELQPGNVTVTAAVMVTFAILGG